MIKRIEIENFRCFQNFSIDNLAPITIIGGRNNSGKTALLESIVAPLSINFPLVFWNLMGLRNVSTPSVSPSQMWNPLFFNMEDTAKFTIKIIQADGTEVTFTAAKVYNSTIRLSEANKRAFPQNASRNFSSLEVSIEIGEYTGTGKYTLPNSISSNPSDLNFVPDGKADQIQLPYGAVTFYGNLTTGASLAESVSKTILDRDKKTLLIGTMRYFDENITDINTVLDNGAPSLYATLSSEKHLPVNYMGDGVNKALEMLTFILNLSGGILLVDEVENGFHYSLYNKLLKIFFETALEVNCQIIMTTHNKDFIEAALGAMKEIGRSDDIGYQRLGFSKGIRKAFAFTGEELTDAFEMDMEMR